MRQQRPLLFLGLCWLGFVAILLAFMLCVPLPPSHPRATPTVVRVLPASPTPFVFATPSVTPRETILAPTRTPLPPTLTFTPMPTRTPTPDAGTRVPVQRG